MVRADFGGGFVRPRGPLGTCQSGPDDDPGQKRLDDLGRKIEAVREQHPEAKPAQPSGRLNVVYRLSTEFVAAVFVGLAFGWGFDALTGLKPIGIILFSVLGIAAAFYTVVRAMRQLNAEQDKEGK
jgi:ATP synthase protein I